MRVISMFLGTYQLVAGEISRQPESLVLPNNVFKSAPYLNSIFPTEGLRFCISWQSQGPRTMRAYIWHYLDGIWILNVTLLLEYFKYLNNVYCYFSYSRSKLFCLIDILQCKMIFRLPQSFKASSKVD